MSVSAEIRSLTRRGDASVIISVELSNGQEHESVEFILLDELFLSLDVGVGEIDPEKLSMLDIYSEATAAFFSACSSFAYVPSSLRALYQKLIGKGFSRDASSMAIDIVRDRGFVDEMSIAHRRAELMLKKLWGRQRILRKLREEGFPDHALEYVSSFLEDVDFAERCECVIEKKFDGVPEDRQERDRMYASLSRLGYSLADIKRAIASISEKK